MCLRCGPLIKAIDAFLAKEDNDLSDQLAKEGYLLAGETVDTINNIEELVTKLLEDNADELLSKLNDAVDLKTFFEDNWPEIKKKSNLAKELYKAFKDEFDKIVPHYVEAYLQQSDPGLTVTAISQRTLAWVGNWSHDLAGLMKLETETEIEAVLTNGLRDGLSVSEVARHIAESGIRSPGYRARRAAITEVLRAHGYAQLESYTQCPAVSEKMWRHTGAYRNTPRQNHVDMDGQRVGVKEPFVLTGADGSTYYPQTPRDTGLPASESVNCHCIMQPVVSEEILGLPLEERQRLQAEAIAEDDGAWKAELDAQNKAKAGIEEG